jgi:hypothetical protein
MDVYLAGLNAGNISKDKKMELYLAGTTSEAKRANRNGLLKQKLYILESFAYIQKWQLPLIKNDWHFLLDSGAFTFMAEGKEAGIDWIKYVNDYADFINKMDIDLFFELDIDSVMPLKEVEKLRKHLEKRTGKQSIPVWHRSRGIDYWKWMVKNYSYVAISASGKYASAWVNNSKSIHVINKMCDMAHDNGCKVHGLGYTKFKKLKDVKFDSVDSTSWLYGNIGQFLYQFNGEKLLQIKKPEGTRMISKEIAEHNFKEWIKFQRYAKENI